MTMPPSHDPKDAHPDDERLAALAGDDPQATSDAALVAHVRACDSCSSTVAELRSLRVALAELPDVEPPRPLRLLPPVAAPPVADPGVSGWLQRLRRLTLAAMTLAVALIVVGAVGSGSSLLSGAGSGGTALVGASAAPSARGASEYGDRAAGPSVTTSGGVVAPKAGNASATASPSATEGSVVNRGSGGSPSGTAPSTGFPYEWVLGIGVLLLGGAFLARGFLERRTA